VSARKWCHSTRHLIDIELRRGGTTKGWGIDMTVTLYDRRVFDEAIEDFPSCPSVPFSPDRLHTKLRALSKGVDTEPLFDTPTQVGSIRDVRAPWKLAG